MSQAAVRVENLSKTFRLARVRDQDDPRREPLGRRHDRFWALRDVSFSIPRGRTLGLIGPNGSGKSTLLKILARVMAPESGRVETDGRVGALLELGAGFHPDLTGIENVYLSGALLGLSEGQVDRLLPDIIAFAELERFMDMPVKHFSSGMTARLGFAVATRLAPEVLFMDETFATGDARFQAKALARIAELKSRGHTLVLVSHNLDLIMQLADEALWLDLGQIHRRGDPRAVLTEYRGSGRGRIETIGHGPGLLDLNAMFLGGPSPSRQVKIEDVRLSVAERGTSNAPGRKPGPGVEADGPLEIGMGDTLRLELELAHAGPHPVQIHVETAWLRAEDGRILAQSRTPARLDPERTASCLTLDFPDWPLTESVWRLAVGISSHPDDPDPNGGGEEAVHHDRVVHAGTVRVTTPNPFELPMTLQIPVNWEV